MSQRCTRRAAAASAAGWHRCYWHLEQNIIKRLRATMGSDFPALLASFKLAAFAATESDMRAKWADAMKASDTYACVMYNAARAHNTHTLVCIHM